jgi:exonuclease III
MALGHETAEMANSCSVLTWNVAGRTKRLDEQANRVLADRPDVVCLQEVTPTALKRWNAHLKQDGYEVMESVVRADATRGRSLGVLIASRHPMTRVQSAVVPWPERLAMAEVQMPGWAAALRIVCLHAPLSQDPQEAKVLTLEAVHETLARLTEGVPAMMCGDLNTPQSEGRDGTIQTFARTSKGNLRARLGEKHDQAELGILRGPLGWQDAFRAVNGFEADDRSWRAHHGSHRGYRLDHVLISPNLRAQACAYDHDVRERGLSDHSAMYATIALAQDQTAVIAA